MKTPKFWLMPRPSAWSVLLAPISLLYRFAAWLSQRFARPKAVHPYVICVGNVTAGGTGKTPVVQALARHFSDKGIKTVILLRGYGGRFGKTPVEVDVQKHTVQDVGDEALLHSAIAPTVVAHDRFAGACRAENLGAEVIVMDDGLQNYDIKKDYNFCVVSGHYGFGNGQIIPAGPLRESLKNATAKTDQFVVMGAVAPLPSLREHPILRGQLKISCNDWEKVHNRSLVAFAGIGHPEKFFNMLKGAGVSVSETHAFADHHVYNTHELEPLVAKARQNRGLVVTTLKDYVRVPEAIQAEIVPIHVSLELIPEQQFATVLQGIEKKIHEKTSTFETS